MVSSLIYVDFTDIDMVFQTLNAYLIVKLNKHIFITEQMKGFLVCISCCMCRKRLRINYYYRMVIDHVPLMVSFFYQYFDH
jgi:hypothetical protein